MSAQLTHDMAVARGLSQGIEDCFAGARTLSVEEAMECYQRLNALLLQAIYLVPNLARSIEIRVHPQALTHRSRLVERFEGAQLGLLSSWSRAMQDRGL